MKSQLCPRAMSVAIVLSTLIVITSVMSDDALAREGCTPIEFTHGSLHTEISGTVPPEDVVCYSLATDSGQTASIEIIKGKNIIFSIPGLVDARDHYEFVTEKRTYEIIVGQMMRSVTDERFTIRVSVTGVAKR